MATGQLSGNTAMGENGRYRIEVLDQLSTINAAIEAVALMLPTTSTRCVPESGETEENVSEHLSGVCWYVRSR